MAHSMPMPPRVLYRTMYRAPDGLPLCGITGKTLGVRPGEVPADARGDVHPLTGGMSVTPDDPRGLPPHLRPASLPGGRSTLPLFELTDTALSPNLSWRADPARPAAHGFVEPARSMPLVDYEAHLCGTRASWK